MCIGVGYGCSDAGMTEGEMVGVDGRIVGQRMWGQGGHEG
jgi:hypothetical protein